METGHNQDGKSDFSAEGGFFFHLPVFTEPSFTETFIEDWRMCGIVGYVGNRRLFPFYLKGCGVWSTGGL
jgi:hypothetical protein